MLFEAWEALYCCNGLELFLSIFIWLVLVQGSYFLLSQAAVENIFQRMIANNGSCLGIWLESP